MRLKKVYKFFIPLGLTVFLLKGALADEASKRALISHLRAMPAFKANFHQLDDANNSAGIEGVFGFQPGGRFFLTYNASQLPLKFVSDGKWIAQTDLQVDQTSFIHLDDFPLSFVFHTPERLMKQDIDVQIIDSTNESVGFRVQLPDRTEALLVYVAPQTHVLQGWVLLHGDQSTTRVALKDHAIDPPFGNRTFLLPGANF